MKGKKGESLVRGMIGVMVLIIIGVAVVFEVATDVKNNSTATGTDATILGFIPTLVLVAVVMAVVTLFA